MNFKTFFEQEDSKSIKRTVGKLPAGHQKLLDKFKFRYTSDNTLDNDHGHVGIIQGKNIEVSAPWNYGREWVTLHEIAHRIWEKKMTKELRKEWSPLAKKIKNKNKDNKSLQQHDEELFAMAYAAAYAKHPVVTFHHKEWIRFIKEKVPN